MTVPPVAKALETAKSFGVLDAKTGEAQLTTTRAQLQMAADAGHAGAGEAGTLADNGCHRDLVADTLQNRMYGVYKSLVEKSAKRSDAGAPPSVPTLQATTIAPTDKFELLRVAISSMGVGGGWE